jgi:hypothetical protein
MNSRRRRQMLICPSCARPVRGNPIGQDSTAQACGGCQIGCCTAESGSPPPPSLWQRWVMSPESESLTGRPYVRRAPESDGILCAAAKIIKCTGNGGSLSPDPRNGIAFR